MQGDWILRFDLALGGFGLFGVFGVFAAATDSTYGNKFQEYSRSTSRQPTSFMLGERPRNSFSSSLSIMFIAWSRLSSELVRIRSLRSSWLSRSLKGTSGGGF
jgi:hypothetical protein